MVAAASLNGTQQILDAGCGAGHTALAFAPSARRVMAVDLSESMLMQGRRLAEERHITNVDFRIGDVESVAFPDASFDIVTSRYSAHHWPNPERALAEFRRVLRPGGAFLLSDIVSYDDYTLDTHLQAIELLRDPSHVRDHTLAAWKTMLANAGFAVIVIYTWRLRLEFDDWVRRIATPVNSVAVIRQLMDGAPAEVRNTFKIEADHSFESPGALLKATV
ncbi:MAG: class I SAM-dependent methyltransferase [Anaerolineales bacterium]|nr:class I SAM-dependent methyltransferase [Anaerolineales bacterium]